MFYLCSSLEGRELCPGTRGRATTGRVCPQKSGKVNCSLDVVQKPEASSAVLISYTHTHLQHIVWTILYDFIVPSMNQTIHYFCGRNTGFYYWIKICVSDLIIILKMDRACLDQLLYKTTKPHKRYVPCFFAWLHTKRPF